jgi:hypothetical protein
MLPTAGRTYSQERKGIAAVQSFAASKDQIWRETSTGDVGIDGQLEYVNDGGHATGKLVAVQVKSGPSYFEHPTEHGWKFYPEAKHRLYWEQFPLPVILVLHDPGTGRCYWIDARQALRVPRREDQTFIVVPKENVLADTAPLALFETAGVQEATFLDNLDDVLALLIRTRCDNGGFVLSYFDLFVQGLTNIARSIYYGMDLIDSAVAYNLDRAGSKFGMGLGSVEDELLFGFVKLLLAQDLADINFSDCLIDWVDRKMHPHFVAPLTKRGRDLVELIHVREEELATAGRMTGSLRVAQEGFFQMVPMSYYRRLPRIWDFQVAVDQNNRTRPAANDSPDDRTS